MDIHLSPGTPCHVAPVGCASLREQDAHLAPVEPGEVLLIEADPQLVTLMRITLELEGFAVQTGVTVTKALRSAKHHPNSFMVLGDVAGMSPDELGKRFRAVAGKETPILVVSEETEDRWRSAHTLEIDAFVQRPFHLSDFIAAIDKLASRGDGAVTRRIHRRTSRRFTRPVGEVDSPCWYCGDDRTALVKGIPLCGIHMRRFAELAGGLRCLEELELRVVLSLANMAFGPRASH